MTDALRRRILWVAAAGYSLAATAGEPFTWYRRVATGLPALVILVLSARRRRHPERAARRPPVVVRWSERPARLAGAVWFVLIAVIVSFQLANFTRGPRTRYPTFSSLMNLAFEPHGIRAVAFAAWLALGAYLLRRA